MAACANSNYEVNMGRNGRLIAAFLSQDNAQNTANLGVYFLMTKEQPISKMIGCIASSNKYPHTYPYLRLLDMVITAACTSSMCTLEGTNGLKKRQ